MNRVTGVLLTLLFVALLGITYYQAKVTKLSRDVDDITQVAKQQQETLHVMSAKQKQAEEFDAKYAKELSDAKSENDRLRADIESGAKRLQLNARCPRTDKAPGTPGMDDATIPRLTDPAQRDYLSLRDRIDITTKQIAGLQEYITNNCRK